MALTVIPAVISSVNRVYQLNPQFLRTDVEEFLAFTRRVSSPIATEPSRNSRKLANSMLAPTSPKIYTLTGHLCAGEQLSHIYLSMCGTLLTITLERRRYEIQSNGLQRYSRNQSDEAAHRHDTSLLCPGRRSDAAAVPGCQYLTKIGVQPMPEPPNFPYNPQRRDFLNILNRRK
jgi:hypothetical protein